MRDGHEDQERRGAEERRDDYRDDYRDGNGNDNANMVFGDRRDDGVQY